MENIRELFEKQYEDFKKENEKEAQISFKLNQNTRDRFKDLCSKRNSDMKSEIINFINRELKNEEKEMKKETEELRKIVKEIAAKFKELNKDSQRYIVTRMATNDTTPVGAENFINMVIEVFIKSSLPVHPTLIEEKNNLNFVTMLKLELYNTSLEK